jgi:Uncharacterized protein conserved in bacteria
MLIINADDFGSSAGATDVALRCYQRGRITSVSAMVFMADSERAAEVAKENRLDVGLHLNFDEAFTGKDYPSRLSECHRSTMRYLRANKYAELVYNPFLREKFAYSYEAQANGFVRLFGKPPSHIDGHHHRHLCANILLSNVIPRGTKMRRNFSFWPGEKSLLNRAYRALVDRWLSRRYQLPDYFFDLSQSIREKKLDRLVTLARSSKVELMTHPAIQMEEAYLMSDEFGQLLQRLEAGSYALV